MPTKKVEIEDFILRLLNDVSEVSVRSIAKARGIAELNETERRAIRRALRSLEDRRLIIAQGRGPARSYVLFEQRGETTENFAPEKTKESSGEEGIPFTKMELSPESRALLEYVSQDVAERTPVGYDQEFLLSYEPNRTFYLTEPQREALFATTRSFLMTTSLETFWHI
ncbi:hypothetical protein [Leptolyngbya sp. 7M]|uniref:hypothetical protein n=1 Tax=Leptolyngbya sp. 7M TaxID=2812896 RepID=UPI001B8D06B9|nr:hypothetical protein [Leptolyngbya sp. 7M]QYO68051.1 hypothetical protein JVX88_15510 [Leptolyngbya sp. 7M]